MKIIKLNGNNFEIGRKLGKFWGDYFGVLDQRIPVKRHLYYDYREWLQDNEIDNARGTLLKNMTCQFPHLYDELVGMNVGINESSIGFKTSLFGLFTCWLAESDLCSSVVLKTSNGYFLAHSDEYDGQYPMLVADVSLDVEGKTKYFHSVSHPFQLLGSAVGMNQNFAFQGNSIGYNKDTLKKLQASWDKRIPKTVFTRMMLEMSSIEEIKAIYQKNSSTLPNHHFVVFPEMAYSVEVKPDNGNGVAVQKLKNYLQVHTNHFLEDTSGAWEDKDFKESKTRYSCLETVMKGVNASEQIQEKFIKFLKTYKQDGEILEKRTSGVFFFTIQNGKPLSCEVHLLYGKKERELWGQASKIASAQKLLLG